MLAQLTKKEREQHHRIIRINYFWEDRLSSDEKERIIIELDGYKSIEELISINEEDIY